MITLGLFMGMLGLFLSGAFFEVKAYGMSIVMFICSIILFIICEVL